MYRCTTTYERTNLPSCLFIKTLYQNSESWSFWQSSTWHLPSRCILVSCNRRLWFGGVCLEPNASVAVKRQRLFNFASNASIQPYFSNFILLYFPFLSCPFFFSSLLRFKRSIYGRNPVVVHKTSHYRKELESESNLFSNGLKYMSLTKKKKNDNFMIHRPELSSFIPLDHIHDLMNIKWPKKHIINLL